MRQLASLVGGGQQLLGEGVAFGAGDDHVRQRRRQGVGARRQQRGQLLVLERSKLQHQRRARAPDALGQPAHPRGRGLVRAVGRQQQHPPVAEVVGEEDDQVERGGVGPVQVLEHQQHRRGGRAVDAAPASPGTRAAASPPPPIGLQASSRRRASTNGWYGSSVPTRSIEAPEQGLEPPAGACRSSDASRVLPMHLPATGAVVPPPPRRVEGAPELPELADVGRLLARAEPPSRQYRPADPGAEGARTHPAAGGYVGRRRGYDRPTDATQPLHGDDPVDPTDTRRPG